MDTFKHRDSFHKYTDHSWWPLLLVWKHETRNIAARLLGPMGQRPALASRLYLHPHPLTVHWALPLSLVLIVQGQVGPLMGLISWLASSLVDLWCYLCGEPFSNITAQFGALQCRCIFHTGARLSDSLKSVDISRNLATHGKVQVI